MSIVQNLVNNKVKEVLDKKLNGEENKVSGDVHMYNKLWLKKIEREYEFTASDNKQRVENILKKLNERNGHCPCGGMTEQFLCPCEMMRTYGKCKCGLYNNVIDLNPREGISTGKVKEN